MAAAIGCRSVANRRVGSLMWRVTISATAILIGALVIGALASAGLVRRSLTHDIDATLTVRVDQVEALVRSGALPTILEPSGSEVGQVQVIDASGSVLASTAGLAQLSRFDAFETPIVGQQRIETIDSERLDGEEGEQFRVAARTIDAAGARVTIWAISTLDAATSAQRYLRNGLLVGLPILIALALYVISRIVDRSLAPVDAMRAQVDLIETTDLSARVTAKESDDEIARLALTLNRLLDRVEQSAMRQRLFAAAASHELRSPLSAIRTQLEVGMTYPDRAEWSTIASDVLIEVDRLELLSRDLRALTRVRDQVRLGGVVDLAAVAADELARRDLSHGLQITTQFVSAQASADVDSVIQVLRILLDNAQRHAQSAIEISTATVVDGVELRVVNDGPAVPTDERERIFEPFMRLDEARAVDDGGSGLGLAIARATMQELGGRLVLDDSPSDRGTSFVALFPLPAQPV